MALGAGRDRLIRQLALEHFLLATIAGVVAAWLSALGTRIWSTATATLYSSYDYSASASTSVYLIAVTLGAAALVTLAPVARLWRLDVNAALKHETRSSTIDRRAKYLSDAFVAGQMTLAVILIAGAGVLGRSVWNIVSADVGVDSPERVLIGNVVLPAERYGTPESRLAFFETLKAKLASLPAVEAAAIGNARPVDDFEPRAVEVESDPSERHATPIFASGADYFRALGATVLSGRDFAAADRAGAPPVALVNQRFADAYFAGQNPIGQRIRIYEKYRLEPDEWRTIVGIVSNVMQNESARQQFHPAAYLPLSQQSGESLWFFVRATQVWDGIGDAIRAQVREVDPKLEIADYSTLEASLGFKFNSPQMGRLNDLAKNAVIAPIYASLALLLAVVGVYAVVARSVGRRRTEMGIRMALGASPSKIRRLVLVEGMAPVGVGLVLGIVASLAVNRILQSQLVGVSPYDVATLSLAPLVLITVALVACLRPASRAVKVDPAITLRQD
jgi:putative ABC transport system permease protein